jgi:pyruvate/2-oxoglutarate/acetoin dehydrogenase E1 component
MDTVVRSVRRTHRALVCHEAPSLYGFGGEIASGIAEACWADLAAPVARLGALRTPMPYAPSLEAEVVPSEARLDAAIRALVAWA